MPHRKAIVFITLILALIALVSLGFYSKHYSSRPFVVDLKGSIVLGSSEATIEMILFEDFQCSHCQAFSEKVLPQIEAHYIDTGVVRCIIVPLPLFSGSKALSNAALTIFNDNPDRLFPFLKQSAVRFEKDKVTDRALLELADRVGGIDLEGLERCIEEHCYYADIDKNLKNARRIMKKNVLVPTLYVNGEPTLTSSFETVSAVIEKFVYNSGRS